MKEKYEAINNHLCKENDTMKACVDSQEQQQQQMQQQITELLGQPMPTGNQLLQEHQADNEHKRDTPTTPTAMTDSPVHNQQKMANNMVPHNLMASLAKTKLTHHSPTQSCSLTAITETAQGFTQHSPGQKASTSSTSYTTEMTGGIQK
jgi:hypothetical protein